MSTQTYAVSLVDVKCVARTTVALVTAGVVLTELAAQRRAFSTLVDVCTI